MKQLQNIASELPLKTSSSNFLSNFFFLVGKKKMWGVSFYAGIFVSRCVYVEFVYMFYMFVYAPVFMHIIGSFQTEFLMNLLLFYFLNYNVTRDHS